MDQYAPCPRCHQSAARKLSFTWWGGALGPRLLSHVKCESCGAKYNGKTGRDNTTGIIIYFAVVGFFSFALFFIVAFLIFMK